MAALTTVAGVEIARVGEWDASTGTWQVTEDDLHDAVRAASDPAFRSPVLKLGHVDPRFNQPSEDGPHHDGTPAVGRLANLRIDDSGEVLVADLVGVPTWLADVMGTAYPSRSIEALLGVVTGEGRTYRMVVTGLALLGETPPAIESLADVAALFEQDTAVETWVAARAVAATLNTTGARMPRTATVTVDTTSSAGLAAAGSVAASASIDELYQAAINWARVQLGQSWLWVREIWTDSVVVDDDDGRLWQFTWSETGGAFTFGEPVAVKVTYTPISGNVAASAAHKMSVPLHYERGRGERAAAASTPSEEQQVPELGAQLRERLGLPADATDDAVLAAYDEATKRPANQQEESSTPEGETPTPGPHADGVQPVQQQQTTPAPADDIDARLEAALERRMAPVLERLGTVSAELADRKAQEAAATKSRVIEAALQDGKISPATRAQWEADYDEAPAVTTRILASLAKGTAFPVTASGRAGVPDAADDLDRENAELFGEVARG